MTTKVQKKFSVTDYNYTVYSEKNNENTILLKLSLRPRSDIVAT